MFPKPINRILFYVVPLLLPVLFFWVEASYTLVAKIDFYSEYGIEPFQEFLMLICFLLSLLLLLSLKKTESRWLFVWAGLMTLACAYITLEEISWGQKFIGWSTPDFWAADVTQKETNIHNQSQLFNRVPRTILEIGILVAGLIIPAFMKWAPQKLPQKFAAIYPFKSIAVIGLLSLCVKILERFPRWLDIKVFYRKSEVLEVFMYYFIFLYLITLIQKWKIEGRTKS